MTQEEKQLLLKVLCSMLPYGIKFKDDNEECIREIHYIKDENVYIREYRNLPYWIDTIKPYLRPMSSMTEEERKEFNEYTFEIVSFFGQAIEAVQLTDWLNARMFDIRGLIPKGLALEAPENMYKIK